MREYELIAETVEEAQRASTEVDSMMDMESGQLPLFYRLEDGRELPFSEVKIGAMLKEIPKATTNHKKADLENRTDADFLKPKIDTGYLSQRGLQSLKKQYRIAEKGA